MQVRIPAAFLVCSADLLSLVATSEKVSSATQGVMSFNSRRRLHQPIKSTPLFHRADSVIQ